MLSRPGVTPQIAPGAELRADRCLNRHRSGVLLVNKTQVSESPINALTDRLDQGDRRNKPTSASTAAPTSAGCSPSK